MGTILDFLKPKKMGAEEEYVLPVLAPKDLTAVRDVLAQRRAQEELLRKYGIDRASAGSV
jgi:hypothetical protein